jgi:small subunit ribosomal protein S7
MKEALEALQGALHESIEVAPKPAATPASLAPSLDTMHHHIPPPNHPMLDLLTNHCMRHGKRAKAQRVVTDALLHIHAMTRCPPMPIVEQAILAAAPTVRCKKQKHNGGKTVYLPMALSERQRTSLGMRWIVETIEKKGTPGKTMAERLARELIACVKGTSPVIRLKEEMHKTAMVNRYVSFELF